MDDLLTFAADLAQQTGTLLLKHHQPGGIRADVKADRTAVTEADLAADQFVRQAISEQTPQYGLVSEEANTIFPDGEVPVWVVDPLDGTTNFVLGLHYWGVSIALLTEGEPNLAALYFPLLDELFTAQKGLGAFLNGKRIRVKPPVKEQPFAFFSCCSRTHLRYNIEVPYKARILGSAAYGLSSVARGSALLAFEVQPKIWDFAGSWLLTEESGGVIQALSGGSPFPLIAGADYKGKSYPILAAATSELVARGQNQIVPKDKKG